MNTTTLTSPASVAIGSRALVPGPAAITAIAIALAAWYLNAVISWRQAALFVVGAFAGVVLYHAAFGFTSAWRVFIADRRGAGFQRFPTGHGVATTPRTSEHRQHKFFPSQCMSRSTTYSNPRALKHTSIF